MALIDELSAALKEAMKAKDKEFRESGIKIYSKI